MTSKSTSSLTNAQFYAALLYSDNSKCENSFKQKTNEKQVPVTSINGLPFFQQTPVSFLPLLPSLYLPDQPKASHFIKNIFLSVR